MPQLQLYARDSMLQLYRDAGIDIDLYRDEPGLEVDRGTAESRDRGGHGNDGAGAPLATQTMYRDFACLDQPAIDACAKLDRPGAFIFNCWVEAWGDMRWFRPADDDPNAAALAVMDGRPAEGLFGMNSAYPKDGFWWDSQLRITPGFQAGVHFLEPYAQAVADLDACRITRGGLFLDKAHSQQLQQFARAYRALPRRKFTTVGPSTDPVAVRTLVWDNRRYIYAVNRDYYPVNVEMVFSSTPTDAEDLAIGKKIAADDLASFVLGPYELRSFSVGSEIEVARFDADAAGADRDATAHRGGTDAGSDREGPGGRHSRARHGRNRAGHSRRAGRRQAGLVAAGADKLRRQKMPRSRRIVAVPCNTRNSFNSTKAMII